MSKSTGEVTPPDSSRSPSHLPSPARGEGVPNLPPSVAATVGAHVYLRDASFVHLAALAQYAAMPVPVEQIIHKTVTPGSARDMPGVSRTPPGGYPQETPRSPHSLGAATLQSTGLRTLEVVSAAIQQRLGTPIYPEVKPNPPKEQLSLKLGEEYIDERGNRIAIMRKELRSAPYVYVGHAVTGEHIYREAADHYDERGISKTNPRFNLRAVSK